MHNPLHRFVRKVIISELQGLLNDHPFYSTTNPNKFQSSPTFVMERFNFEGRHYPVIIVTTTSTEEVRLAMNRLIDEVYGHSRPTSIISYVAAKIGDDPSYPLSASYTDAKYLLEVVNTGSEQDEDIKLKITQTSPIIGTPKFFDMPEDGRLIGAIPGVRIIFGPFNDRIAGQSVEVQTFEKRRYLGDIYGSRFKMRLKLEILAQSQNETEELLDLINSYMMYIIPQRVYFAHHINILETHTEGIDKDGKLGEEFFRGTIDISLSVENNMFIPFEIIEKGELWFNIQQQLNKSLAGDINKKIAEF